MEIGGRFWPVCIHREAKRQGVWLVFGHLGTAISDHRCRLHFEQEPEAASFLDEAYKHCKAIAATGAGVELLNSSGAIADNTADENPGTNELNEERGVVSSRNAGLGRVATEFITAIAQHRHWEREPNK